MLQSEYDVIVRHKRLKVLLIILTAITVAVVVYTVIRAGKEEMPVSAPAVVTPKGDTEKPSPVSPEENKNQPGVINMAPGESYNPTKQGESVQQPVSAGTSSAEAERDRLREIGSKIPVPPPPPGVK
ncbi:MAG: hypothetical protein WAU28_00440 [Candidatus Moraniibacteriota bacterium]